MATVLANIRRMLTQFDPHPPNPSHLGTIHPQRAYCSPPDRRQPNDFSSFSIPGKVVTPALLMGMKQRGNDLSFWVYSGLTTGLMAIAAWTGEAKVFKDGSATR